MPKEKSFNPVAAQRKADKKKEISKSKRNVQDQRNEKLARRNPERLQKQIDELKELETRGVLRPKDKETLTQLERDVRGIWRAREALGDKAPQFPSHERRERNDARQEQRERRQNLGKRRRDSEHAHDSGSDTDPEVRNIPMPRDTPPPIPREKFTDPQLGPDGQRVPHALPSKPAATPAAPPQLVYSSAPQLRDLKKEAVKFVPAAVRAKQKQVKGEGRLLEPEEIDNLEKAGYYAAGKAAQAAGEEFRYTEAHAAVKAAAGEDVDMDDVSKLQQALTSVYPEEEESVPRRQVMVEDVDDEGD
ncbi:Protein saf1 [Pseudocercospora fuligena]|uniref:Protein saf1 n=1 Tax=Pseudocercospora fuligena TaxID=685502 RepID=A0A8H6VM84_9PEZI|nr:Protein saf1 [Pseudocercospora fuligena]